MRISTSIIAMALGAGMLLCGCGPRENIREDFGKSMKTAFLIQRVWPAAATGNPLGLDSEEAAMIQSTYRNNMGGKGSKPAESNKVLILEPNTGGNTNK